MFRNILVPLDGSRLAECVLPHVVGMARAFDAPVTLLHVLDEGATDRARFDLLERPLRHAEGQAYLAGIAARLRAAGVLADTVLREGAAASNILDYAHETRSDLLVLSSHGRSGLAQWNVSGVVQKVIQDARSSLLLVRAYLNPEGADAEPTYQRLLLPLDGSKRAECILPVAESLARTWDADLLLTHVIPEPQPFPAALPAAEDQALLTRIIDRRQAAASRYFEQLQARLRARSHVYLGVGASVFDAFHEIVETTAPDLVLFSAHGRGFSPSRPYGRLVTSCILYGCASLLILQDVAPEQLEPTAAQLALQASGMGSVRRRETAPRREPYLSRVN